MRDETIRAGVDDLGIPWVVLARYMDGEGSPDDIQAVEVWLANAPNRQAQLATLREGWEHAKFITPVVVTARAWGAVRAALDDAADAPVAEGPRLHSRVIKRHPSWRSAWIPVSVAALALITVTSRLYRSPDGHQPTAAQTYTTTAGQRLSIALSDGTHLTLGPVSQVAIDPGYQSGRREVRLEGEGYFDVVHDAHHPFAVHTRKVTVRDIGTAFDIRAYPEDSAVRIAVAEGVVGVANMELHANDVAITNGKDATVQHGGDVAVLTAWRQGRLVFDHTPLSRVILEVSRTFDLKITITDSVLAAHRITGSFANESATDILNDIAGIVGGRYERNGHTVVITPMKSSERKNSSTPATPLTLVQRRVLRASE